MGKGSQYWGSLKIPLILATSAEVTPNGGLVRESPHNPLNSGSGIIVTCPDICLFVYILVDRILVDFNQHRFIVVGTYRSGQIIATSHDLTPKGSYGREIPLFQGNPGW